MSLSTHQKQQVEKVVMIQTSNGFDITSEIEAQPSEVEELYTKGWYFHYSYMQWDRKNRKYRVYSPTGKFYGYSETGEISSILKLIGDI